VETLLILLAVRPTLFRDSLRAVLTHRRDLQVIDAEPCDAEILAAARQHRADVVVASLEPTPEIPPLVSRLLAEFPGMTVVGIDLEGGCARIYRDDREVQTASCENESELIWAITGGT
jgi:DNA-binding NarL/FixJ family response regulator